jgi:hypothetical protein
MRHLFFAVISVAGAAYAGAAWAAPDAKLIASAESAAPRAIAAHATVAKMGEKGLVIVRKGTNGWTCLPDDPGTPGRDPMCVDENGMAWAQAWMEHKAPPADKPGLAYMLEGGSDASNLDPYATKPAAGEKWVTTGPHIMVLSAAAAKASGYPSGQKAPDTSKPYIMFGGTPYAHIMFPVK